MATKASIPAKVMEALDAALDRSEALADWVVRLRLVNSLRIPQIAMRVSTSETVVEKILQKMRRRIRRFTAYFNDSQYWRDLE